MEKQSQSPELSKDALKALLNENEMSQESRFLNDNKLHTFVLTAPLFSACDRTAYSIAKMVANRWIVMLVPRNTARDGEIPDYKYFFTALMDRSSEAGTVIPILAEAKKAFEKSMEKLVDIVVEKRTG
jgi:hypothetical protein